MVIPTYGDVTMHFSIMLALPAQRLRWTGLVVVVLVEMVVVLVVCAGTKGGLSSLTLLSSSRLTADRNTITKTMGYMSIFEVP